MVPLSQAEKEDILRFLADSLSFAKTLDAFPALTINDLRQIILETLPSSGRLTIYIDGASRGNPGPAGIGVFMSDIQGKRVKRISRALGRATNNVAEYQALLAALDEAWKLGARQLEVFSDSELVVKQMTGSYQVKEPALRTLWSAAQQKMARFDRCTLTHVPRENNSEANKLAQDAVDKGKRLVK